MLATLTDKLGFECVTCSRCGGTGQYSYNSRTGTTCFQCLGAKIVRTKRGRAAYTRYTNSLSVPLADIVVGDTMQVEDMARRYFARVVEVTLIPACTGQMQGKTFEMPACLRVTTEHAKYGRSGLQGGFDTLVRKGWDADTKAARLAEALAFQSTLNAKGA